jgi:endo-alpha-1,4-polygalactosaminidase (GH114 family)
MDILDKYAWHIHNTIATVENAKEQKKMLGDLFRKVREICRARSESFDVWCKSGEFGLSKSRIYQLMNGTTGHESRTSSRLDPEKELKMWVAVFHSWDVKRQREALIRLKNP